MDKKMFARFRKQLTLFGATRAEPKINIPDEWVGHIAANNAEKWNTLVDKTCYPPEIKAAHRLPSIGYDPSPLSWDEFREWLLGFGSREYTLAFADHCAHQPGQLLRDFPEMPRGLALHFPSTGTFAPAAAFNRSPSQVDNYSVEPAREDSFWKSSAIRNWWGQFARHARIELRVVALFLLCRQQQRQKPVSNRH